MNVTEPIKICGICGEKASARNFCAITCESCKAFFRRNASKIDEFNCIFGNECEINLDTRKRCRKCRLKKCFKVGMRKEWILNEEEKKVRNTKIEENRKKKTQNDFRDIDLLSPMTFVNHVIHEMDISEVFDQMIKQIDTKVNGNPNDINQSIIDCGTQLVPIVRPLTDYTNNFTETEGNIFNELLNRMKVLDTNTIFELNITSETKTYSEAMRLISYKWDEEIRNMIKTVKSLSTFRNICKDDQILLFKYGSGEIELMRSIACYEIQDEYWVLSLGQNNVTKLSMQVFKENSDEEYERCKSCINKLAHLWDFDQIILHLLIFIVLFTPTRPKLKHRSIIRLQQKIYMHLLNRYLQLKYRSDTESKFRFSKLMEVMSNFQDLHEKQKRNYFVKDSPTHVFFSERPLLKELYDDK